MVLPGNAYYPRLGWVSSNPSVAKVNTMEGLASPEVSVTAVITAYALDGSGVTARCMVTVDFADSDTPELPPIPPEQDTQITYVQSIKLNQTSVNLKDRRNGIMLEAKITHSDVTSPGCRWTSSDNSVALVNSGWSDVSSQGYVTAVSNRTLLLLLMRLMIGRNCQMRCNSKFIIDDQKNTRQETAGCSVKL